MRTAFANVLFALLLSISSLAQSSRADLFMGYSFSHADLGGGSTNLNGFDISYTVRPRFRSQWFGLIVDVSRYFGSAPVPLAGACSVPRCVTPNIGSDVRIVSSQAGVRLSRTSNKFTPFVKMLIGGSSLVANSTQQSYIGVNQSFGGFSYSVGGGADYRLSRRLSWRVQGDFLETHFSGNLQNYVGFSTGPMIYFGLAQ
jgi:Outer membrane protein beta-barrel domain